MRILLLGSLLLACAPPPPPQNLVFISLDTTRKDHLSVYGYSRETSPHLDRLAGESFVFSNAVAQWTTTNPSHTSMFSGLYPHTHGVGGNTRRLAAERPTLAEILHDAGFRTGAFVSGYPLRIARRGLGQGFEVYDCDFDKMRRDGKLTAAAALDWLRERRPEERYFLFLHLYDAHGPYKPPDGYEGRFHAPDPGPRLAKIPAYQRRKDGNGETLRHLNEYVDRYDDMIRYQDDVVGEVLAAVDLERTAVLVTADHGETLGERARVLDHGKNLFEEQVAIPFVLHVPGGGGHRVDELVETVDYLPTLLELLAVPRPESLEVQGESLVPLMQDARKGRRSQPAFSSGRTWAKSHADRGYFLDKDRRIHAVRAERFKLIVYPGLEGDYLELYDLESDPLEQVNVAEQNPEIRDALHDILDSWLADESAEAAEEHLTPEEIKNMKALGYLGD